MGENSADSKNELLNIFVKEEDKYGSDPLEMTNYLDVIISKEKSFVNRESAWDYNVNYNGLMGCIANAIKLGYDFKEMSMFVADNSHFSKEIVDKLKEGKYILGPSKEVGGNFRPVIINNTGDKKGEIVKHITLKRAINPSDALIDISNISMQMSLHEISSQIESVKKSIDYLIESNRNISLKNLFINARNEVKNANNSEGEERLECLKNADKYLSEGMVNVESDIKSQIKTLSNLKGRQKSIEEVDKCVKFFTEDMALLFRYVGLKYYLLEYRKEHKRADELLKEFAFFMSDLNTISENNKFSGFQVIHQYFPYEKKNVDFWLTEPQKMIDVLNMRLNEIEQDPEQVVYIDVED